MDGSEQIPVGIIGTAGYGSSELLQLLDGHPKIAIADLSDPAPADLSLEASYPYSQINRNVEPIDLERITDRCRVVILALNQDAAWKLVPSLLSRGCKVLDLSADYRFTDLGIYRTWYSSERTDQTTAETAVYGLPELYRQRITNAQLVGCPGYYPTASLLALSPLLKQGLITLNSIIIDAKLGAPDEDQRPTSTPVYPPSAQTDKGDSIRTEFARTVSTTAQRSSESPFQADQESLMAYSVLRHRHTPEIEQIGSDLARQSIVVQFTPHRVPTVRGLLVTVYARLRDPGLVREDLLTIYGAFYRNTPWIKVLPNGVYPQARQVRGTNTCHIGVEVDPRTDRVITLAAIDPLIKGRAGQAVQCLNLMMGWEETLGLLT